MKKLFLVMFAFSALAACSKFDKTPINPESPAATYANDPKAVQNNDVTTNDNRMNTGHVGNNGNTIKDGAKIETDQKGAAPGGATTPANPHGFAPGVTRLL